jgi:hypothetical protein
MSMKTLSGEESILTWGASVCIISTLCELCVSNIICVSVTLSSNVFVF